MPEKVFDFTKGLDGKWVKDTWVKYWVWWTKNGFTNKGTVQDLDPIILQDAEEFPVIVDSKLNFIPNIDTFTVRLHNMSCPNAKKDEIGLGNLETYIWQKNQRGDPTTPIRLVPTTGEMGKDLPPYWIALPAESSSDNWGSFVIPIIDDPSTTKLLVPKGRLAFRWSGRCVVNTKRKAIVDQKPKLKAQSLELYVVCANHCL